MHTPSTPCSALVRPHPAAQGLSSPTTAVSLASITPRRTPALPLPQSPLRHSEGGLLPGELACLAELLEVAREDLLHRRLVDLVASDHGEACEVSGVHVRRREDARRGEDLLDVRLVRDVHRRLLEDNVVKWEGVLEVPHEGKLVHESLLVGEGGDAILCKICPSRVAGAIKEVGPGPLTEVCCKELCPITPIPVLILAGSYCPCPYLSGDPLSLSLS